MRIFRKPRPRPHPIPTPVSPFTIIADKSLGSAGQTLAQELPRMCEQALPLLDTLFNFHAPRKWTVCLGYPGYTSAGRDGSMGACHLSGTSQVIYSDIDLRRGPDLLFQFRYVVCEMVEVYAAMTMSHYGAVWNPVASAGEALSRVITDAYYPYPQFDELRSTVVWIDSPTRPDWITRNEMSDQDGISVGCAAAMLWYLNSVLKKDWIPIVRVGGMTLQDVYSRLGGQGSGYAALRGAIDARFPVGKPSGLFLDNPFV